MAQYEDKVYMAVASTDHAPRAQERHTETSRHSAPFHYLSFAELTATRKTRHCYVPPTSRPRFQYTELLCSTTILSSCCSTSLFIRDRVTSTMSSESQTLVTFLSQLSNLGCTSDASKLFLVHGMAAENNFPVMMAIHENCSCQRHEPCSPITILSAYDRILSTHKLARHNRDHLSK